MSTKIKITQIEQENIMHMYDKKNMTIYTIYDDRIFVYITSEINIYKYRPKLTFIISVILTNLY